MKFDNILKECKNKLNYFNYSENTIRNLFALYK